MATKKDRQQAGLVDAIDALSKSMLGIDLQDELSKGKDEESENGDEDEDEDEEEPEEEEETEKGHNSMLFDLLKSFPEADQAIDASNFLKQFALANSQAIGHLSSTLNKSLGAQDEVNVFMAKSVAILAKGMQDLQDTLDAIAGNPAGVKTLRSQRGALNKSFGSNNVQDNGLGGMSREVAEDKLVKAIGEGALPMHLASTFDNTGTLPSSVLEVLKRF